MYQQTARILLTLMLPTLLATAPAMAQFFVFTATITESVPDTSAKPLFSAITQAYPDAELFHHRDRDTLVILTTHLITFEALEPLVNPNGFTLVDLERDFLARRNMPGTPPVPQLRQQDEAALRAHGNACRQWAMAHPDAYHLLVNEARNLYRP
jgi:hypothetical protein